MKHVAERIKAVTMTYTLEFHTYRAKYHFRSSELQMQRVRHEELTGGAHEDVTSHVKAFGRSIVTQ